jgi:hypothetical protein
MVLEMGSFEQLRDYFLHVICHSRLSSFAGRFLIQIQARCEDPNGLVSFLIEHFDVFVFPVYSSNIHPEITSAMNSLLRIAARDAEEGISFFGLFVSRLPEFRSRPRVLNDILRVMRGFLDLEGLAVLARDRDWLRKLADCLETLPADRIDLLHRNPDFANLFELIAKAT